MDEVDEEAEEENPKHCARVRSITRIKASALIEQKGRSKG